MPVSVKDLKKSYLSPNGSQEPILDVPSFELHDKQQVAMRGASGSGKTTFLHLLAGIIRPDEGQILLMDSRFLPSKSIKEIFFEQGKSDTFSNPSIYLKGLTAWRM